MIMQLDKPPHTNILQSDLPELTDDMIVDAEAVRQQRQTVARLVERTGLKQSALHQRLQDKPGSDTWADYYLYYLSHRSKQ